MVLLWWVLVDIFREAVLLGEEARRRSFLGLSVYRDFWSVFLGLEGKGKLVTGRF